MLAFIKIIQYSLSTYIFFLIYHIKSENHCRFNDCIDNTHQHHALCKFQSVDPKQYCIGYEKTIKTNKDKHDILEKINSRRNKVASGDIHSLHSAENIMKMEWSDALEISAQRWANQCLPYKDLDVKDICRHSDNVYVGQNIATVLGDSPGLTPAILVDVWYMELLNMNASLISRYRPSNQTRLRHYDYFTQLVWAESNKVGCGSVKFKEPIGKGGHDRTINRLICNFAPGGNQIGRPVYNEGLPCSRCSFAGICDSIYPSLCNFQSSDVNHGKLNENAGIFNNNSQPRNVTNEDHMNLKKNKTIEEKYNYTDKYFLKTVSETVNSEPDDQNVTAFDYFAHLFNSMSNTEKTTTTKLNPCKDVMPVEDFIEVFKKRLIKDQALKDFFLTSKMSENSDSGYTDASVANFINHIYSIKEVTTSPKTTVPDYFNSTLLVDLVEAVIFRNNDKVSTTDKIEQNTNDMSEVSAIRIKAELGEVQTNFHSTGHYFFPVDDNDQDIEERTESYYDSSSIPVSDIVLEIQELKRNKGTKDFLDEILESDFDLEKESKSNFPSPMSTISNSNENRSDNIFLESFEITLTENPSIRKKKSNQEFETEFFDTSDNVHRKMSAKIRDSDTTIHLINYRDLLRKIAFDLDILKLNERFHCTGKSSLSPGSKYILLFAFSLLVIYSFIL